MSVTGPQGPERAALYRAFLFGTAAWFSAWGIQMVMFQWLVVEVLQESPVRVGTAQMTMTLPSLLFLLMGGAAADRTDPRRLLMAIHAGAALAAGALCALYALEWLTFRWLLVYAFVFGTLQAFALPARDTQLSDVTSGSMSRSVAGALITQHGAQVAGAFCAAAAGWVGGGPLLLLQAGMLALGIGPVARLPGHVRHPDDLGALTVTELLRGISEVFHSRVLFPILILAVSTGVFFVGPFLVILPLMVRDVYDGGAAEMAVLSAMFPLGAMVGGMAIVGLGGIQRNGVALVLGQMAASASIAAIGSGLPFLGSVAAVFAWGLAGSLFINAGRTIFQTHASLAHRARVLSVYTLGIMGGGPVGSVLSGWLAGPLGLHATLHFDAAASLTIALGVALTTRVLSVR